MKKFFDSISPKTKAKYLLWILFHFILFLLGMANRYRFFDGDFFPFEDSKIRAYDLSEFLIYTVVPVVLYYVYFVFNSENKEKENIQIKPIENAEKKIESSNKESTPQITKKELWDKYKFKPGFIGSIIFILGTLGYLLGFEYSLILWPIAAIFLMYAFSR